MNWRHVGEDCLFGPHQFSDGALRAIALITVFQQPEDELPNLIVVDEPELGLHPDAMTIVAGLMRAASSTRKSCWQLNRRLSSTTLRQTR